MDRPAAPSDPRPERAQALLARLAAMDGCAGFEWRPEGGAWLWTDADAEPPGAPAPASLDALSARYDAASQAALQAALTRLVAGEVAQESLDLLPANDTMQRARLRLQRAVTDTGVRITGLLRVDPSATPATDAHVDSLTGLSNRRGVQALGAEAVRSAQREGRMLALLFLDLDRFKQVNDTFGHAAGDELLRAVARRLRDCVRGSDVVARQSGDEFIVVLSQVQRPQDAALVAQKILDKLLRPTQIAGQQVSIGCSIGVALLSEACPDLPALLRAADTAMYAAKQAGRNTFRFFHDAYFLRLQRRAEQEQELKGALARDEFFLVYQPYVRLADNRPVGIEALLRWRTTDGEVRAPAEFLPLAQESGDIVAIGDWVMREACRQARIWKDRALGFERLTINLSAQELRDATLPTRLAAICAETRWPADKLELELTDAALLQERDVSRRALAALQALGVRIALDDFGTGMSNLIYLHRFQIRTLKLDRHFALGMQDDPALQEVVQAVIAMVHALHLRLVAKGVETAFAADFLTERGCDEAQGFHFARPLPAADVPLWVQARDLAQLAAKAAS